MKGKIKMENILLECPYCRSNTFYIKHDVNGMVFFNVNEKKEIIPKPAYAGKEIGGDFSVIFCTGCSWEGNLDKLYKRI